MSDAATTGAFALGGVIIGGSVSGTVTYVLARRVERRTARAAARLVRADATQTSYALRAVLDDRTWRPIKFVTMEQWNRHRDTFADHLRNEDWKCVEDAYADLQRLLGWVEANGVGEDDDDDVDADDVQFVQRVWSGLDHAITRHLTQLSHHGPQRRRLALRYWHLRAQLRGDRDDMPPATDS